MKQNGRTATGSITATKVFSPFPHPTGRGQGLGFLGVSEVTHGLSRRFGLFILGGLFRGDLLRIGAQPVVNLRICDPPRLRPRPEAFITGTIFCPD
jgi:hypothetical protein